MNFKCENPEHNSFSAKGSMSTCLGWVPTFDKEGRQTNTNPNTVRTHYTCNECGSRYVRVQKGGVTEFLKNGEEAI